jgi:hypothetical protein
MSVVLKSTTRTPIQRPGIGPKKASIRGEDSYKIHSDITTPEGWTHSSPYDQLFRPMEMAALKVILARQRAQD